MERRCRCAAREGCIEWFLARWWTGRRSHQKLASPAERPIHLHCPFAVHGNLRGPPKGFPCCCEVAALGALSCPVITRSFSASPSNTSVVVPSLMPVLICTGSGLLP